MNQISQLLSISIIPVRYFNNPCHQWRCALRFRGGYKRKGMTWRIGSHDPRRLNNTSSGSTEKAVRCTAWARKRLATCDVDALPTCSQTTLGGAPRTRARLRKSSSLLMTVNREPVVASKRPNDFIAGAAHAERIDMATARPVRREFVHQSRA